MAIGKSVISVTDDTSKLIANARTGYSTVSTAGSSINDGQVDGFELNKIAQNAAGTAAAAGDTALMVAKSGEYVLPKNIPGPRAPSFATAGKTLGAAGGVIAAWGLGNDSIQIYRDWDDENTTVKATDTLSWLSNATAVGAAGFAVTGAGAPVAVVLGVTSVALGVASAYVDSDLSLKGAVRSGLDVMNDAVVHGLGNVIDGASRATLNFFDPQDELPEISGSQQNQLMAISKSPSFNYTSHKKDSVAGYTLYQMLDNAEDTISSSSMNGFTVYVMGKTIQPTCMGDEAGIGGGIRSGTVGKEIRATSGAPSIFYCGYMSIRANDTCTMNNENVEGKYISLC